MITIALIEVNYLMRLGMERLLAGHPRLRVVASVGAVEELDPRDPAPSIVVLGLAGCPGAAVPGIVTRLGARSSVLTIAGSDATDVMDLLPVLEAGACGVLTTWTKDEEFLAAVQAVACGGFYLPAVLARPLLAGLAGQRDGGPAGLAPREAETLRWIACGFTHRQIARRMGLTDATVSTYAKRLRGKLGAGNAADLTRKAIELGYAPSVAGDIAPPPALPLRRALTGLPSLRGADREETA
jgi:DNA-binding NarL/FixJ family response regulator